MLRRDLFRGLIVAGAASRLLGATQRPAAKSPEPLPTRELGKTGVRVTQIGLGGWNVGRISTDAEAENVIRRALDLGITFFDNAPSYFEGRSEERYGRVLPPHRKQIFLMTKTLARGREEAAAELDASLKRLRADYLDLWQFHAIGQPSDVEKIFGPGGAYEAAAAARKAGKVRFIGITGHHNPAAHGEALKHADLLDTIQMPINVMDPHYHSFLRQVVPRAAEARLGIIAMKTLSMGRVVEKGAAGVDEALRFVLSQPVSVLITGVDSLPMLEHNVEVARRFSPMSTAEQEKLLARTAPLAGKDVEYYKI